MIWMIFGFVSVVLFMAHQLLAFRYDCYHCVIDPDDDKKYKSGVAMYDHVLEKSERRYDTGPTLFDK